MKISTVLSITSILLFGLFSSALADDDDDSDEGLAHRVTQLEEQLGLLEQRVAEFGADYDPQTVVVRCAIGESVTDAAWQARNSLVPLQIIVVGNCTEHVWIGRDNVELIGSPDGGSINGYVYVVRGRNVVVRRLSIEGGLGANDGASVYANGLSISGGGVNVDGNSVIEMSDSTIQHAQFGARVEGGGALRLSVCNVRHNFFGISVISGEVRVGGSDVSENNNGASVFGTGHMLIEDTMMRSNGVGLFINASGSTFTELNNTVIELGGLGVEMSGGSLRLRGGSSIRGAESWGINAVHGSHIFLENDVEISENLQGGIVLGDTSVLSSTGGARVVNNTGVGIYCEPPPAVAQIRTDGQLVVSGNGGGDIACPVIN